MSSLSDDQISELLAGSSKKDPTEERTIAVWFNKVNHVEREEGCQNPDCQDPRPPDNRGRKIVGIIKGKNCCRTCFLNGWLSDTGL